MAGHRDVIDALESAGSMTVANLSAEEIGPLLAEYSERSERWKTEHADAMRCRDLEDLLVLGVTLHLAISIIDNNWHDAMFGDRADFTPEAEQEIAGYYRAWFQPSRGILTRLEEAEAAGFSVKWADQFRRACRETGGVLTPDPEFFVGDALVELRDEAIDDHHAGRTVEFHELGD